MWEDDADELFPNRVTLSAPGTMNSYGRRSDGADTTDVACLIEHKMRQVRNVQGELTSSSTAIYFRCDTIRDLTPDWQIVSPIDVARPIVSVARYSDEDGEFIEVAYLS